MKKTKIIAASLAAFAILGLAGCQSSGQGQKAIEETAVSCPTIVENGIRIRMLSTGTDVDGKEYITVGYTLTPSNTTHTRIDASVAFKDSGVSGTASDYVTATVDTSAQTVKIKKVADFSNVITVTLEDHLDTSVNAAIDVHLKQRFLGWGDSDPHVEGTLLRFKVNSVPRWPGLQRFSSAAAGFSSIYTDEMTSSEKAVTVSDVFLRNVDAVEYWEATATNFVDGASGSGAIGRDTVGSIDSRNFIANGTDRKVNGTHPGEVLYYATGNPEFWNKETISEEDFTHALVLDAQDWTVDQKNAAIGADLLVITAHGGMTLTCDGEETDATFSLEMVIPNSYFAGLAVAASAISPESSAITF